MSNEEIFQTMKDLVSEQFGMELDEVTLETSFEDDLGADSLASVELAMALEEATGVSIDDDSLAQMKVVGDIMNYLKDHSN